MLVLKEYKFTGCVLNRFGNVIARGTWTTMSISQGKAASNIRYRINADMGMAPTNKLTLSGTWEEL